MPQRTPHWIRLKSFLALLEHFERQTLYTRVSSGGLLAEVLYVLGVRAPETEIETLTPTDPERPLLESPCPDTLEEEP